MQTRSMTFRLPLPLSQALEDKARRTGTDRTEVVIAALTEFLGVPLPEPQPLTLADLEAHIVQLESSMSQLTEQLVAFRRLPSESAHQPRLSASDR